MSYSQYNADDGSWQRPEYIWPAGSFDGVTPLRIIAYLIDAFILLMAVPIAFLLNLISFWLLAPVTAAILAALPFIYHTLTISSARSATIGQRIMGLRVARIDGERPTFIQALVQTLLFYATLALTGGLLLLWCLFDNRGRCLHDILSGAVIVRDMRIR